MQCTLIVQFQQASDCSKSTVNTRKRCKMGFNQRYYIGFNLTVKTHQNGVINIVLVSLLLTLNIFRNFFYCFYCWLWPPLCMCRADLYRKTFEILWSQWHSLLHFKFYSMFLKPVTEIKKVSWCQEKWGRQQTKWYIQRVPFYDENYFYVILFIYNNGLFIL